MFATSPTVMGFIKGGRMRPLMISMRKNSPSIPGIPGSDDAGVPGFESTFWFGLYAPAGTPMEIVRRLHAAAAQGPRQAGYPRKDRIAGHGLRRLRLRPKPSPRRSAPRRRCGSA
jgi:hypothetical protein